MSDAVIRGLKGAHYCGAEPVVHDVSSGNSLSDGQLLSPERDDGGWLWGLSDDASVKRVLSTDIGNCLGTVHSRSWNSHGAQLNAPHLVPPVFERVGRLGPIIWIVTNESGEWEMDVVERRDREVQRCGT